MPQADLVLLHAPSVYDFRKESILYGPVSDLVPSTPVFEMYPIGLTTIAEYLERHGFRVRIVNLAVRMLNSDRFDAGKADPQAAAGGLWHRPALDAPRPRRHRGGPPVQETPPRYPGHVWRLFLHLLSRGAGPPARGGLCRARRLDRGARAATDAASDRPPRRAALGRNPQPDLAGSRTARSRPTRSPTARPTWITC